MGRRGVRAWSIVAGALALFGLLGAGGGASSSPAPPEAGLWLTEEGDARIRVHPCEAGLCGEIVWLAEPYADDGAEKRDVFNPDESVRDREVLGMRILEVRKKDGRWAGTIYDPNEGKTYRCKLHVEEDDRDRLKIRGYVGIPLFGRTTHWTRAGEDGG